MTYHLPDNPRSLGDLVGLAFRLLRTYWKIVIQRFLTPSVFMSIAMAGLEWCFVSWAQAKSMNMNWFFIHIGIAFAMVIVLIASQWEIALRSTALIRFILLQQEDFDQAYEYARNKQWSIMCVYGASFLAPLTVWFVLGAVFMANLVLMGFGTAGKLLAIFLALVEGFFFVVTFSFSILFTALSFIEVSLKPISFIKALTEGFKLTLVKLPRGLSFICLLVISILAFTLIFYVPVALLEIWEGVAQGKLEESQFPIYIRVLDAVVGCIVNIISVGAALFGVSAYYRDLKMRVHGEDILKSIEALELESSDTAG